MILHASAGAGHRRAAEALATAFTDIGDVPVVRDILDFTPAVFRRTYASGYLNMVKAAPELWGYMYNLTDRNCRRPWERRLRLTFNRLNTLAFFRFYQKTSPDAVVCTHFMPLELLGGKIREGVGVAPLFGVVTDFAAHSLWVAEGVEAYAVATNEAGRQLIRRGVPATDVYVTGIPVAPEFSTANGGRVARLRLGMEMEKPIILILCGGFGVGPAEDILNAFRRCPLDAQLVFVAGNNRSLERSLRRLAAKCAMPCYVFGFVFRLHELVGVADVVVSKPGGLTASEVMAAGCPLVVTDPIPGQEQRNGEWLLEKGAAIRLVEPGDAPEKVAGLLADPAQMAALREAAVREARPNAAAVIVNMVRERVLLGGETRTRKS
jgi:processive 1,2-diacylglycerol beta-glucosyltransferase